jgi:hypothetical protein
MPPMQPSNILRVVLPKLAEANAKLEAEKKNKKIPADAPRLVWKGWHAFRRGVEENFVIVARCCVVVFRCDCLLAPRLGRFWASLIPDKDTDGGAQHNSETCAKAHTSEQNLFPKRHGTYCHCWLIVSRQRPPIYPGIFLSRNSVSP